MNRASILSLLTDHRPFDGVEDGYLAQTLEFVRSTEDFASRLNEAGHLTGSAWVVNPAGNAVLLIHHVNLDRWLQPGGHVENGDASIQSTAMREACEECGIPAAGMEDDRLYDIDVHPIPERKGFPAHLHYDFRFLVRVEDTGLLSAQLGEVQEVKWFSPLEIEKMGLGPSVMRMMMKLPAWKKTKLCPAAS